jgi:hypothetical protein
MDTNWLILSDKNNSVTYIKVISINAFRKFQNGNNWELEINVNSGVITAVYLKQEDIDIVFESILKAIADLTKIK